MTIPVDLREETGLLPGIEVEFTKDRDGLRLTPARPRGETLVERFRSRATSGMSTEEIMALTRE